MRDLNENMTITEVADALNDCADNKCEKCKFICEKRLIGDTTRCQSFLIEYLGGICRKLGEDIKSVVDSGYQE